MQFFKPASPSRKDGRSAGQTGKKRYQSATTRVCSTPTALLKKLAKITVDRGCGRLEWACLDWNQPSIDFYRSLSAVPMDEWTTYRLTGDTLLEMVK